MKRILFVFLTFCPLFSFAQNSEEKNKNDSIGFQLSPFEITHLHILGGEHWYKDNESERTTFFTISSPFRINYEYTLCNFIKLHIGLSYRF